MKFIKYILAGLLTLAFLGGLTAVWYANHASPDYSGDVVSASITKDVTVYHDSVGVPHIYGSSEEDVFFALGYIQARERLFQMELLRRVGSGRLSEVLGKDLLPVDKFFRALGIGHDAALAAATWDTIQQPWVVACKQYLKGVNTCMQENPLPEEFILLGIPAEPFKPEDIYLITGYMAFSFAEALKTDPILSKVASLHGTRYLEPFGIKIPESDTSTAAGITETLSMMPTFIDNAFNLIPSAPWLGSNGWVISGSRTVSGKPILANDTHIGYQQPAVWYEAHLSYPGHELYGHFLAGLPFPLTGHTLQHAWGLTMFENDDMNLYSEELNGETYRNGYQWKPLQLRKEVIRIKGEDSLAITIRSTQRGPIVSDLVSHLPDSSTQQHSLWWSYSHLPWTAPSVTYELMKATTLTSARNAAAAINAPGLNILYANTAGDIACWSAGKIPVYEAKQDTRLILDGAAGNNDPIGYGDFSNNPQAENPAEGMVISANQDPSHDSTRWGIVYGYYPPHDRHNRIQTLLDHKKQWGPEEMMDIQFDATSTVQAGNAHLVATILKGTKTGAAYAPQINALLQWSGDHQTIQTEPTIWYATLACILEQMMSDELGPYDFGVFVNTHMVKTSYATLLGTEFSPWWDNCNTLDHKETRSEILEAAFMTAMNYLKIEFGEDMQSWEWGKIHTLTHAHPAGAVKPLDKIFNVGPFAAPGGIETVNNAGFPMQAQGKFPVKYGAAMRNIMDMSSPEAAWSILPTGQSGHVASEHYDDQAASYMAGRYRMMSMDPDKIKKQNENVIRLRPSKKSP